MGRILLYLTGKMNVESNSLLLLSVTRELVLVMMLFCVYKFGCSPAGSKKRVCSLILNDTLVCVPNTPRNSDTKSISTSIFPNSILSTNGKLFTVDVKVKV